MENSDHWNRVYGAKPTNRVSWYQDIPALSLKIIDSIAGHESRILDVGGGASTLVDSLLDSGFQSLGVLDVSVVGLRKSKERLADAYKSVEWFYVDVREFRDTQRWDVWHDRAVFHFLTAPEDQKAYMKSLDLALKPGGHVVIATFALDGPEKCSGLDVERYDSEKLRKTFGSAYELVDSRREVHLTPEGREQNFQYALLRRSE